MNWNWQRRRFGKEASPQPWLRVLERLRKVKNELTTVSFSVEDLDLYYYL
jgi:hypothetical protein